jgi:hypothetical protein
MIQTPSQRAEEDHPIQPETVSIVIPLRGGTQCAHAFIIGCLLF